MFGFRKHNDASEKGDERNPHLTQILFRLIDQASRNTGVSKDRAGALSTSVTPEVRIEV